MNKQLSTSELQELSVPLPVMSRTEKLTRWAKIIRESKTYLHIFDRLEYSSEADWNWTRHPGSAFTAAYNDPVLREAGLASDTVGEAKRFFELSREDIHAFSCNCGGDISNEQMANRIEVIAGTKKRGILGGYRDVSF